MQSRHDSFAAKLPALKDFTLKAQVDWMEFCVTLQSPSQFRHVQARMLEVWGKGYFEPVEGPASSKSFIFRLHNPPRPDQFMRELQAMALPGDPPITEQDVIVRGIEIALDAYIPGSDRQALALAVTHFLRHQAHPPAGRPRITAKARRPYEPTSIQEVLQALLQGGITINSGPMGDDHTCRFYIKDYDTIAGVPYAQLPPDLWRARFENTLQGKAVPFTSIDGWRNCPFGTVLADRFALVLPDPAQGTLTAAMQDYQMQLGRRPDAPRRRPSDRRLRGAYTRRNTALNDKIRQALRALTRAQSCQNSVTIDVPEQHAPLESSPIAGQAPEYGIDNTGRQFESTEQERSQDVKQSLLTMTEPVCGSSSHITHTDVTPRQEGQQTGPRRNQCDPPVRAADLTPQMPLVP
ncbi:MAG: hypothetical protein Q7T13_19320 [Polaromonas sp.]|nr:hypothetical protein [Polaromonas sp.]